MKLVIAPDSFKGSLSAQEVCAIVEQAFAEVIPEASIVTAPMADGGEGTLEVLVSATQGHKVQATVQGPLGASIPTHYGVLGDQQTVVIEMALVAGLTLLPKHMRDPAKTSTYGVGQLMLMALNAGYRRFIICLGGSGTNDGGLGFLKALGGRFWDRRGQSVAPVGGALRAIEGVDLSALDARLADCQIAAISDVHNPLCGANGASMVFGPQKGATAAEVRQLDGALGHFARLVEAELHSSIQDLPGAGAAGGLGFGLLAVGGEIQSGAHWVAKVVRLEEHLRDADYVITGEGKTDDQTLLGKVPYVVAQLARIHDVPTLVLSGAIEGDVRRLQREFASLQAIVSRPMELEDALIQAGSLLDAAARNLASLLRQARKS